MMTLWQTVYGSLETIPWWISGLGTLVLMGTLAFIGAGLLVWAVLFGAVLIGLGASMVWLALYGGIAFLLCVTPIRRLLISRQIMGLMKALGFLPRISDTEKTAIEAGTVWVDGELFSGKPDWKRITSEPYPELDREEREFLEGPCEQICRMTDDWKVFQDKDLSPEVWDYAKKHGFFGLIIPKEYGGKGFSAMANSAVVAKLSSRSMPLGITVMVPNSLGPAELLVHYGTEEQKKHYLPKLAVGEEIPCFALTEPGAGSDAGAMNAHGVVFRAEDGNLKIRLYWSKRYITLAAVSTVLGLAFKLRDPENLLGQGEDLGITCALIPTHSSGVVLGRRHDPLGVPFYNCPTKGEGVEVPIDAIIGGTQGAGQGWKMLMECLAAGRGISLPATSTAGAKMVARVSGAYATVRKQFGLPIGRFSGIEEPLAEIGAMTYMLDAARVYTCGALDGGAKPAVVTAITKYNFTEIYRRLINHGMDILGGAAISRGPRNLLAHAYIGTPISITVEGANILTRTLMIFGQGAIRCHPYAYQEIAAVMAGDSKAFDKAFFAHIGHVVRNTARSMVLSVTRGRLSRSPVDGEMAPYYRKLNWASASFALLADMAMASLGGDLKRRETLTGRFSDIFSWMYLGTCALRRFEAEGRPEADRPFVHWCLQESMAQMQKGFDGLYENFDHPILSWLLKPVALWSRLNSLGSHPHDSLSSDVARKLQTPGTQRDRLTDGIYRPTDMSEALGRLDRAFELCSQADDVVRKIKAAMKSQDLPKGTPESVMKLAVSKGIISEEEAALLAEAEEAREDAIQVDCFTLEEYAGSKSAPPRPKVDPFRGRNPVS